MKLSELFIIEREYECENSVEESIKILQEKVLTKVPFYFDRSGIFGSTSDEGTVYLKVKHPLHKTLTRFHGDFQNENDKVVLKGSSLSPLWPVPIFLLFWCLFFKDLLISDFEGTCFSIAFLIVILAISFSNWTLWKRDLETISTFLTKTLSKDQL